MAKNLKDFHEKESEFSAKLLFEGQSGKTVSIYLQKDAIIKEHTTAVKALLICVQGHLVYHQKDQSPISLQQGQYVNIPQDVPHWVEALKDSEALLLK
ncbi:cupin domain-containing protein [Myroides sp. LJL116]